MQDQDPLPSGPPSTQPSAPQPPAPQPPAAPPPAAPPPAAPPEPPPPAGHGARWGEPGYQAPPDPDRQGRIAVAWVAGILGGLGLVVVAIGGFAILFAMDQRQPAPVTGAPLPTFAPQPTVPPSPGQDPTGPTTGQGSEPPSSGDGAPSRSSNAFYSIKIPEGFQDVTGSYRGEHPADADAVQALAGQPGSPATPGSTIVISRLPAGAAAGRSLDRLAADRVRELQRAGAGGTGPIRHSSIGPDPAVEVDLVLRSAGERLQRTQVLCVHAGRVWEIAVTSPAGSRSLAAAAWTTVKTGWQWR